MNHHLSTTINTAFFKSGHTFSAKEKDDVIERSEDSRIPVKNKKSCEQTGYSYTSTSSVRRFGARYYDSVPIAIGIRVWLSVDPLADKYPDQSPYSYVGNRPIIVIDPNGEDEWEVEKATGKMTNVKTTDNDVIYQTVDGKRTGVTKEFTGKVIQQKKEGEKRENGTPSFTQLRFKDSESMEEAFNFIADNTDVEWSGYSAEHKYSWGKSENLLATSHEEDSESRGATLSSNINKDYYDLKSFMHSHPDKMDNECLSDKDIDHRDAILKDFPNVKFTLRYSGYSRDYSNPNRDNNRFPCGDNRKF